MLFTRLDRLWRYRFHLFFIQMIRLENHHTKHIFAEIHIASIAVTAPPGALKKAITYVPRFWPSIS